MRPLFLFLFAVFSCVSAAVAQDNNLAVDGSVKDIDGGRITGAFIQVYQDGSLIDKITTGRNGRFDLILDYDHEYIVEVGKKGFVSKRLQFNTGSVPEDGQAWGYEYGGFVVDLFKELDGVDYSMLDEPVTKIYFDTRTQGFDHDKAYLKIIKEQLAALESEYKAKVRELERQQERLEEDFKLAMQDGQLALEAKDFLTAKENFLAAASLNPDSPEPQRKIAEVETAIEQESGAEEKYLAALATADELFNSEKYAEAKLEYDAALKLKPGESYPKTQKGKCDEGIARLAAERDAEEKQKAVEEKYQQAIATADKEFQNEAYQVAKRYYNEAASIKPSDEYATAQIGKIDELLAAQAAAAEDQKEQEELERQYNEAMSAADAKFKKQDFDGAIENYEKAAELKPSETLPGEQIAKVRMAIAEMEEEDRKGKLDEQYRSLIAKADDFLKDEELESSKQAYNEALGLKPDEQYPKDQLAKIDELERERAAAQNELAKQEELQRQYDAKIEEADRAFNTENYDVAETAYNAAIGLKPNETYPKEQLEAIQNKRTELANREAAENERKRLQQEYDDLIASADKFFNEENYTEATTAYTQAQKLKPKEVYPKTQLDVISMRLKDLAEADREAQEQKELDESYAGMISAGDREFEAENLDKAEEAYREAASLKPNEAYPEQQLEKIASKREELAVAAEMEEEKKRIRTEFDEAIARADKLYEAEKLADAKVEYEEALKLIPGEQYPTTRIEQIDRELLKLEEDKVKQAELQKLTEQYENFVARGDELLQSNDLSAAKNSYLAAQEIKPDEVYPKNQIAKINQLMKQIADKEAEEAELKARYDELMKKGDAATANKEWNDARKAYQDALKILPNEKIPSERLLEIDNLEAREAEMIRKQSFDDLVAEADKVFLQKELEQARDLYNKSLEYFPNAQHPKERIARIDKILEELSEKYTEEERKLEKTIVEETYMEGNRKVTVRKVTIGDKEEIYKRVVHPWGGKYYFLNDRPISELVWTRETTAK